MLYGKKPHMSCTGRNLLRVRKCMAIIETTKEMSSAYKKHKVNKVNPAMTNAHFAPVNCATPIKMADGKTSGCKRREIRTNASRPPLTLPSRPTLTSYHPLFPLLTQPCGPWHVPTLSYIHTHPLRFEEDTTDTSASDPASVSPQTLHLWNSGAAPC